MAERDLARAEVASGLAVEPGWPAAASESAVLAVAVESELAQEPGQGDQGSALVDQAERSILLVCLDSEPSPG